MTMSFGSDDIGEPPFHAAEGDRAEDEHHHRHQARVGQVVPVEGPAPDQRPSEYVKNGQIFIGCEGNEEGLAYQIQRAGNHHFLFASDFPHEIGPDDILHEIEEVAEAPISDEDKRAVLRENAKRLYCI